MIYQGHALEVLRRLPRASFHCAVTSPPYWSLRDTGDLYRFDGWTRVADVKASGGGGTWTRPRKDGDPKSVWVYVLGPHSDDERRAIALERAA